MEILKNRKKQLGKRGSEIVTTPIIIAIGILFISILIVFVIQIISPYIWYEKLSSTCLKYIFVMEEYGYLTSKEKRQLETELLMQGFQKNELNIICTNKKQKYGEPIYLNINYLYYLDLPIIGRKEIPMNITRESISKR